MKRDHQDIGGGRGGYPAVTGADMAGAKGKMAAMIGMEEDECGVDELLAALGYKVRASDMADVAQKLQQLEVAMASTSAAAADDASLLPQIASDTVHYDPSDLSTWLDNMLSELNAPPPSLPPAPPPAAAHNNHRNSFGVPATVAIAEPSAVTTASSLLSSGVYDFRPIPPPIPASGSRGVYGADLPSEMIESPREPKRMRTCSSSSSSSPGGIASGVTRLSTENASSAKSAAGLPVVVVDTQETGIRLVHALLACAEAVQQENFKAADALVKQISMLAAAQGGPMRKVAGYFAEAIARRIYRRCPRPGSDRAALDSPALDDLLQVHFYESCPYLKFAHFTANQAILEAFASCRRVHVIDFGLRQGMQWPALLQALALRPGGPPSFRLTGIGPPQADHSDALQQVGWKLVVIMKNTSIEFHFRGFVAASLVNHEPWMLLELESDNKGDRGDDGEEEAVAVNFVMELHRLLARPGAMEKVLGTVHALWSRIITMVEEEANHNGRTFLELFTEALHYYSSMFDSLESDEAETTEEQQ